jgi:hypothetical protein
MRREARKMNTMTGKRTLRERHPELFLTAEERKKRNLELRAVLRKFIDEGDAQEQKETGDFLMNALAEARESNKEADAE